MFYDLPLSCTFRIGLLSFLLTDNSFTSYLLIIIILSFATVCFINSPYEPSCHLYPTDFMHLKAAQFCV